MSGYATNQALTVREKSKLPFCVMLSSVIAEDITFLGEQKCGFDGSRLQGSSHCFAL